MGLDYEMNEWDEMNEMDCRPWSFWSQIIENLSNFTPFTAFLSKGTIFTTFSAEWLPWTGKSCNQSPSDINSDTFDKNSWQCWFKGFNNLAKRINLVV